jgi:hypothetical protein
MKPNLFIIGASKCATTTLWAILKGHPDIFMSEEKEPSHFVKDKFETNMLSYLSLFEHAEDQKYIGEASPVYSETTTFPDIAKRIYDFNPEAKIIYIVREPLDRLQSVWKQTLHSGHWYQEVYQSIFNKEGIGLMPIDFEEALLNYPPFIEATKYYTHLNNYRKYFDDENILLLFYEDLKKDQSIIEEQICRFLNVEQFTNTKSKHSNKSSEKKRYPFWFKNLSKRNQLRIKYVIPPILFDQLIKRPVGNVRLNQGIEKKVYSILEEEISKILEYGNKPHNFWSKNRSGI